MELIIIVLILIVMEERIGFPYIGTETMVFEVGLNPYCNGRKNRILLHSQISHNAQEGVLILIVMEERIGY